MKKALIFIPLTILAGLAVPAIAKAHNATAAGTCQEGVTWNAFNFDKTVVNAITVTIDGTVRWQDSNFKSSDTGQILTDKTTAHTWDVFVNAPGTQFDKHPSGSYAACVVVPTTTVAQTVPATTTTVASSTTVVDESTTSVPASTTVVTDSTTTSVVAVDIPPVPTTAAPSIVGDIATVEPALPATGVDHGDLAAIAVTLLLCGGFLLYVRRVAR